MRPYISEDPDDATKVTFIMLQSIMQGSTYVDAGVSAFDAEDGDLTAAVAAYGGAVAHVARHANKH